MNGWFYNIGRMVGPKLRKANWVVQSLTGNDIDAIQAEQGVGRDLAQAILETTPAERHPEVETWLVDIGGRLTACLRPSLWEFRFYILGSREVNAFALPGGYLFFTRALLEMCVETPDEMAFVMAHEMGHVVKRHAIHKIMADTAISTALTRLPIGGGMLRVPLSGLVTNLLRQGYSQDQELEADRFAAQLAVSAGFDPASPARALSRLARSGTPESLFSYFSSHPPLAVRLERFRQ